MALEPVLIFPDDEDQEGVLIWAMGRDWRLDEPFELLEDDVDTRGTRMTLKVIDHAHPEALQDAIVAHLDLEKETARFFPVDPVEGREPGWMLFVSIVKPLAENRAYAERLCRRAREARRPSLQR